MRLAYAILAHRDPEQVARLVRRLAGPDTTFVVHVELHADEQAFRSALGVRHDVVFVRPRIHVLLFSYRMVEAQLACIGAALRTCPPADRISFISGQTYPLQSAEEIYQFLADRPDRQFMEVFPITADFWQNRIDRYYFNSVETALLRRLLNKGASFFRRRVPMPMYGGSMWATVTAAFAEHLLQTLSGGSTLAGYLRHTHVPDEMFLQTVAMNSRFAETVVNDSLHHLRWQPGAAHPDTFTDRDLEELEASGKPFARKFDLKPSLPLLERLDRRVRRTNNQETYA